MIDDDALYAAWEDDGKPMSFERLKHIVRTAEAASAPDPLDLIDALNGIEGLPPDFNLQTIVEALRPFLRVPMSQIDEPLLTKAWNILPRVDGDLIVCRHLHPNGEECDPELWVRYEELSEESRREAVEIIAEKRAEGAEAVLDALDERFILLRR